MKSVEVSAKTDEEAIAITLAELGLSCSEVEVVIVKKGKTKVSGLGSEGVRVRVTPLGQQLEGDEDVAGMARAVLQDLLSLMKMTANVVLDKSAAGDEGSIPLDTAVQVQSA
jgi:predicted RNA-binding protein Jag